jgi:hypothetical protein
MDMDIQSAEAKVQTYRNVADLFPRHIPSSLTRQAHLLRPVDLAGHPDEEQLHLGVPAIYFSSMLIQLAECHKTSLSRSCVLQQTYSYLSVKSLTETCQQLLWDGLK